MNSPDQFNFEDPAAEITSSADQPLLRYVPWLIVGGLAILFLPLYAIASTLGTDAGRLDNELANIQLTLVSNPTAGPELISLESAAAAVESQLAELEAIQSRLNDDHVDWPAVSAIIVNYDPASLALTAVDQVDTRLILSGFALDDMAVTDYAAALENSGQFARVVVQSISLTTPNATQTAAAVTPTATPIPSPTPNPTTLPTPTSSSSSADGSGSSGGGTGSNPTSVPDPRDDFEYDDYHAPPIFLGELQQRNFYPTFDVDTAVFLAKAGRFYQVQTAGLAIGVDTFLTVRIGESVLTNDDAQPGTLASLISFQMTGGQDADVTIQVTNRGQYGTNMTYQLIVQEIVPTVAPTAPPQPTAIPAPPTATFTPTPDLRDIFEPDEPNPAIIAVGQIQTHNFYPNGDVDHLSALVKEDRFYQVATSNLALGVDTDMNVQLDVKEWQNDDYSLPGSGNFASGICFPAESDGQALITVSNLGQVYTPNMTYNISLVEAPELQPSIEELVFGPVIEGSPNPPTQTVQLVGSEPLDWSVATDADWIGLNKTSGTTPVTLTVSTDITGLDAGEYEEFITFRWNNICQRQITVTLQVDAVSGLPRGDLVVGAQSDLFTGTSTTANSSPAEGPLFAKPAAFQNGPVEFVIVLELRANRP